jgi:hypothetical protein
MNPQFYTETIARKRPWTPTVGDPDPVREGSELCLQRALACRILELDVADWLETELAWSQLPEPVAAALRSNQADEARHDQVLNMAAAAYGWDPSPEDATSQALRQEWLAHPDPPVVKAAVLESSVFFVILPLLRRFGGVTLRVVSRDISGDETAHAAVNRQLSADLGYTFSPSLSRLRRRTVEWIVEPLRVAGDPQGTPEFWLDCSDSLLERGTAPQLRDTRRASVLAFFEVDNGRIPKYR